MSDHTLAELTTIALRFRDERDWKQFHNPKDVALSMSLEVAELIEIMQWRNGPDLQAHLAANQQHVGEELADILYWILILANDLGIDLPEAFIAKQAQNAAKYPVEQSRGIAKKYNQL